jgi:hypothetical protein
MWLVFARRSIQVPEIERQVLPPRKLGRTVSRLLANRVAPQRLSRPRAQQMLVPVTTAALDRATFVMSGCLRSTATG